LPERPVPIRFRKNVPTAWLKIVLREGRNRQARRMTAAVGHPTLRLVRVAVGPILLADLAPGQWRDLTPDDRASPLRDGSARSPTMASPSRVKETLTLEEFLKLPERKPVLEYIDGWIRAK